MRCGCACGMRRRAMHPKPGCFGQPAACACGRRLRMPRRQLQACRCGASVQIVPCYYYWRLTPPIPPLSRSPCPSPAPGPAAAAGRARASHDDGDGHAPARCRLLAAAARGGFKRFGGTRAAPPRQQQVEVGWCGRVGGVAGAARVDAHATRGGVGGRCSWVRGGPGRERAALRGCLGGGGPGMAAAWVAMSSRSCRPLTAPAGPGDRVQGGGL